MKKVLKRIKDSVAVYLQKLEFKKRIKTLQKVRKGFLRPVMHKPFEKSIRK